MNFSRYYSPSTFRPMLSASCLCVALLMASCGSTPTKVDETEPELTAENIEYYISTTANIQGTEKVERQLNAAEYLFTHNDLDRAHALTDSIDQSITNENQYLRWSQHFHN